MRAFGTDWVFGGWNLRRARRECRRRDAAGGDGPPQGECPSTGASAIRRGRGARVAAPVRPRHRFRQDARPGAGASTTALRSARPQFAPISPLVDTRPIRQPIRGLRGHLCGRGGLAQDRRAHGRRLAPGARAPDIFRQQGANRERSTHAHPPVRRGGRAPLRQRVGADGAGGTAGCHFGHSRAHRFSSEGGSQGTSRAFSSIAGERAGSAHRGARCLLFRGRPISRLRGSD